jgi:integrase/recombinase XerD
MTTATRKRAKPAAAGAEKSARQTPLERLIDEYLDSVKNDPDPKTGELRTEKTLRYYTAVLVRELLPWCNDNGITQPSQLDQKAVDKFYAYLRKRGARKTWNAINDVDRPLSDATAHSYARAINRLLHWAEQKPRIFLRKPKKQLRLVLEPEDIRKLEDAAQMERDKLLIRLLIDTGMRASELTSLRADDVLPPEGRGASRRFYLRVTGAKDGRQRRVGLTRAIYERLVRYRDRGRKDRDRDELWLGLRRRPKGARRGGGDYAQLTPSGLGQILKEVGKDAGVDKPTNPHAFRHSFITRRLSEKNDPGLVAKMVGHRSLAMIYENYDQQTEENAADALIKALEAEEKEARR